MPFRQTPGFTAGRFSLSAAASCGAYWAMRRLRLILALLLTALPGLAWAAVPVFGYEVVNRYPHDPQAFTQGLLWRDGGLYESTGQVGASSIRKVELKTGKVLQRAATDPFQFGEGIVDWGDRLIQLTWEGRKGAIYDLATFEKLGDFAYPGEGWGLTRDSRRIIMSDGTPVLRFLDPDTLKQTGQVSVSAAGTPIRNLNELEWVDGEVWANVWQTNFIARIDPKSGEVVGWIDLNGLLDPTEARSADVLNGIAWDPATRRVFVTGKYWPALFEIKVTEPKTP